jgi:phosphatidylserine/phosphatidylglycerophosphate/cardiolipin synthase-like enzyme
MRRPLLAPVLALLVAFAVVWGSWGPEDATAAPSALADPRAARISGVYFDGHLRGDPEPEEAVRITNSDSQHVLELGDFALTDRFGPRRPVRGRRQGGKRGEPQADVVETVATREVDQDSGDVVDAQEGLLALEPTHTVRIPQGTRVPPGGSIWVAHQGRSFRQVFGFPPGLEAVDTDDQVPNAFVAPSWLDLPAAQGVVALLAPDGRVADVVAWDGNYPAKTQKKPLDLSKLPAGAWAGPPVWLKEASPFGWKGQVLARDRDEKGALLPDTDGAADWDSSFSRKRLGQEPIHRVEFPGQSQFVTERLEGVQAKVTCASAPENQFKLLSDAFDRAKRLIRINVYQFTSPFLGEKLLEALARKIKVVMLLEGTPVGGMPDEERVILDRLARAGARVVFLGTRKGEPFRPRYRFNHAKYTIIDDDMVIIGTENYGRSGHPIDPSWGNRGFDVAVENPDFVRQLAEVFETDTAEGPSDLVGIDDDASDTYGLPTRDPSFQLDTSVRKGLYPERRPPLAVEGKVDLELVLSPDTSLSEVHGIIGMINRAKREVLVLQNSIPRFWGTGVKRSDDTPNLALMAVVEAARRGVKVRVLVDGTWYNVEESDARDNDDTVRFLNELGQREGLDLAAKVVNLDTAHLEKIHAKAVMVDGEEVLVSSINWSENSFKGNREVGVIVRHPDVTGYYRELFWRDWRASRLYRVAVRDKDAALLSEPRVGAPSIRRLNKDEVVDVVTEVPRGVERAEGFLEVPLAGQMSGYLRANAAGDHLATPRESRGMYGREVTVTGRVLEVIEKEKVLILGLDKMKGADFQVVIFKKMRERMTAKGGDPAETLRGKVVKVRGTVSRFKGPQIEVQNPGQVTVVE